ncbi:hypothetical protein N7520_007688 [Penicillium odoratum]|uniref:uncharacterized protein n=1 Tax=Penicillium odoratum TaxID=1167516 RepID=UPI00254729E8|nr:uncharacterized protein N7520_007688 [Penicillium odoratum]KAJ5760532.1 hypothetical protein N7520_007688 [Penicillium odoratum]
MGLDDFPANWGVAVQHNTDELTFRLKTWLGCFVVSTNVAACLSLPPPMCSVAYLMPGIRNRIRSELPDNFLAVLEIQAYSTRAASILYSQPNNPTQRSFIELLESDLDAVEARIPSPVSPTLQVGILTARLRLYSLPLLSRASSRTIDGYPDTLSNAVWYKGFHTAMQLATVFADSNQPDGVNEAGSADDILSMHSPKYYFHALVMAGMYFINLLVIDKNISVPDKLLAHNHIKKVYEMLMTQSNEDRDEASRAAKAIDFLSRHVELQDTSLDLRESTREKRPLTIIGSGMRMAGEVRSKLGNFELPAECEPEPELAPTNADMSMFQDGTELPLWGDTLFQWNSWLAGMDTMNTISKTPETNI